MKGHKDDDGTRLSFLCGNPEKAPGFSLEKNRLGKNVFHVYEYLKGGFKEEADELFPVVPSNRTRDNGLKLKLRSSSQESGNNFTVRMREYWHSLAREVTESLPLEVFESHLETVLGH